jgi:hypothetical protein
MRSSRLSGWKRGLLASAGALVARRLLNRRAASGAGAPARPGRGLRMAARGAIAAAFGALAALGTEPGRRRPSLLAYATVAWLSAPERRPPRGGVPERPTLRGWGSYVVAIALARLALKALARRDRRRARALGPRHTLGSAAAALAGRGMRRAGRSLLDTPWGPRPR